MSIFDSIKSVGKKVEETAKAAFTKDVKKETFTIASLPESVDELMALPEASLDTPFKTAALTVCALCAFAADAKIGEAMLNALKGPESLSPFDLSFLKDRFNGKAYVPFSYFDGAAPDNGYTPNEPFTVSVSSNPYSYQNENYAVLYITSGGADSPRPVTLRCKPSTGKWYLKEYHGLTADIRIPKSEDPWA